MTQCTQQTSQVQIQQAFPARTGPGHYLTPDFANRWQFATVDLPFVLRS